MSVAKKMFDGCASGPRVVDPALAVANVRGGDNETFETFMSALHENLADGLGCEVKPVARSREPAISVKAVWADYWADPKKAAAYLAFSIIDEIAFSKKERN